MAGRHESDDRPPIEMLGNDPGITSTQQVAVGRPPKPGRGRAIAILGATVVVVVLGLALGRDDGDGEPVGDAPRGDDERSSTTERRSTTTERSTTTTPEGPPLGVPAEGVLLLFDGSSWETVDLTTGARQDVELPTADAYATTAVRGGVVFATTGEAVFHPVLGGETEPRTLGRADYVVRAGPDRVWLMVDDSSPEPHLRAQLVDLDGNVLRSFGVRGGGFASATADVLLFHRGGRVFAADEEGLRALAVGELSGANGDAALVVGCETDATCDVRRVPTDGSPARVLQEVSDPDSVYFEAVPGPDGQVALLISEPVSQRSSMLLLAADGTLVGQVDLGTSSFTSQAQWLPEGLGLIASSSGSFTWIHPEGDGWTSTARDLSGAFAEMLLVITP